jgi:hypothetical protein
MLGEPAKYEGDAPTKTGTTLAPALRIPLANSGACWKKSRRSRMEAIKGAVLIVTLAGQLPVVHTVPFSTMANCEKARTQLMQEYDKMDHATISYAVVCVLR